MIGQGSFINQFIQPNSMGQQQIAENSSDGQTLNNDTKRHPTPNQFTIMPNEIPHNNNAATILPTNPNSIYSKNSQTTTVMPIMDISAFPNPESIHPFCCHLTAMQWYLLPHAQDPILHPSQYPPSKTSTHQNCKRMEQAI